MEAKKDELAKRLKAKGATTRIIDEHTEAEDATTNVVDFMALLQKSLEENKRTPAGKRKPAKKAPPRKSAAKKAGTSTRRKAAP